MLHVVYGMSMDEHIHAQIYQVMDDGQRINHGNYQGTLQQMKNLCMHNALEEPSLMGTTWMIDIGNEEDVMFMTTENEELMYYKLRYYTCY